MLKTLWLRICFPYRFKTIWKGFVTSNTTIYFTKIAWDKIAWGIITFSYYCVSWQNKQTNKQTSKRERLKIIPVPYIIAVAVADHRSAERAGDVFSFVRVQDRRNWNNLQSIPAHVLCTKEKALRSFGPQKARFWGRFLWVQAPDQWNPGS